jgi:hypothetical protein
MDPANNTLETSVFHQPCIPTGNCNTGDGIFELEIGTISNVSGCQENGYGDFTFLSTELDSAGSYNLTLTTQGGSQHVRVWINFNKNEFFEADEILISDYVVAPGQGGGTYTETINLQLPDFAESGSYIMRIRTNWNAPVPDDACESTTWGETEDYTVVIVEPVIDAVNELNSINWEVSMQGNNQFLVSIPEIKAESTLRVINHLGQTLLTTFDIPYQTDYTQVLNLRNFPNGVYSVVVTHGNHVSSKSIMVVR